MTKSSLESGKDLTFIDISILKLAHGVLAAMTWKRGEWRTRSFYPTSHEPLSTPYYFRMIIAEPCGGEIGSLVSTTKAETGGDGRGLGDASSRGYPPRYRGGAFCRPATSGGVLCKQTTTPDATSSFKDASSCY